jgi:hypothetical protein
LNAILKFDLILSVVVVEHIVQSTVQLSLSLQRVDTDLVQASTEAEAVVVLLRQERADNTVWETLYDRATEIAAANEIALAYLIFHLATSRLKCSRSTPSGKSFSKAVSIRATMSSVSLLCNARSLSETLAELDSFLYPTIGRMLLTLLTMLVSTSASERSFSTMRRIKTYLRSTMKNERLSSIGILHIHRSKSFKFELRGGSGLIDSYIVMPHIWVFIKLRPY